MAWLKESFRHPQHVELGSAHHLRPIRASDVAIDYPAVMSSRERLWAKYGEAWGWPAASMGYEADREDLARHEAESATQEAFNYAILNKDETELCGCLYIDPPGPCSPARSEAVVSWWVSDAHVGSALERAVAEFVPRWLADTWGFSGVHFDP